MTKNEIIQFALGYDLAHLPGVTLRMIENEAADDLDVRLFRADAVVAREEWLNAQSRAVRVEVCERPPREKRS
jgi:hypothetical protein